MVRVGAQMKTSTDVNQGNKQNVCEAFCLNIYLASYIKFTVYRKRSSTSDTHQQIVLGIGIPLATNNCAETGRIGCQKIHSKNCFSAPCASYPITRPLINCPHNYLASLACICNLLVNGEPRG